MKDPGKVSAHNGQRNKIKMYTLVWSVCIPDLILKEMDTKHERGPYRLLIVTGLVVGIITSLGKGKSHFTLISALLYIFFQGQLIYLFIFLLQWDKNHILHILPKHSCSRRGFEYWTGFFWPVDLFLFENVLRMFRWKRVK